MKTFLFVLAAFASLAIVLPVIEAQDDPKKSDEKTPAKKARPITEDEILRGAKFKAKVVSYDEAAKEVVIATIEPIKQNEFREWDARTQAEIQTAGDDALRRLTAYQQEWPKRYQEIFSGETRTVIVNPTMRVRTSFPPPTYDAQGNLKKLTSGELSKLKSGSRLPGYLAKASNLRAGQIVDVYMPKPPPAPKQAAPAKKDIIAADPTLTAIGPVAKIEPYFIFVEKDAQ